MDVVLLTRDPLNPDSIERHARRDSAGAVVTFVGCTRDNHLDRRVLFLEYEAQESLALKTLQVLRGEAMARFGAAEAILHHRLGRVEIGEESVVVAVSCAHRAAAFDACRFLIDTLKTRVPIWKKEHFADGSDPVWVGADGTEVSGF